MCQGVYLAGARLWRIEYPRVFHRRTALCMRRSIREGIGGKMRKKLRAEVKKLKWTLES